MFGERRNETRARRSTQSTPPPYNRAVSSLHTSTIVVFPRLVNGFQDDTQEVSRQ
jgi:hypothetical protein